MKIAYETKNFRDASLEVIEQANAIIREYAEQGFSLTLRQLYYQFVARDLIPNTQRSYKRLGSIVNDARMAGLIDWDSIEDRTRWLSGNSHWKNPRSIVEACANQFRIDLWARQPTRVEVWIEKQALVGVIERACTELDVPYFACKGYVSQSEQWRAGQRFAGYAEQGQHCLVLHMGDHDPSGLDMTNDNQSRLDVFSGENVLIKRIALNMDQIEKYNPPPNPAKVTDSRFNGYVANYGRQSWELDALKPTVIDELIRAHVYQVRDPDLWDEAVAEQTQGRERLRELAKVA